MKRTIASFLFLAILFANNIAFAGKLDIPNECSYIIMDSKSGQVIAEQNADVKLRPASTTKVMTAILALEDGKLYSLANVSNFAVNDIGRGGMHVGIMPGESNLTMEHLLNIMLVKSANDSANIIAENIAGSKEEFVRRMNERAKQLGAVNTNFVNPCGKDDAKADKEHLSTARDMATIARYAMTIPKFREIVQKEWYKDMPQTNLHDQWGRFRTTNRLLWNTNEYTFKLDGFEKKFIVNGVKTGYTSAAGNNLLCSAVNENGMELMVAVMHVKQGNNSVFNYAKELFEYGFRQYENQRVIESDQTIKTVNVEDSKNNESVELKTKTELICALPLDKSKWNITSNEKIYFPVKAPITKGELLGYIEYERNGIKLGKVDLVAGESVEKKSIIFKNETVKDKSINIGLVILIFTITVLLFFLPRFVINKIREKSI